MDLNTIIVDNFLDDPMYIRNVALNADYNISGNYPGKRSYQCDQEYNDVVKQKIESILNKKITDWFRHFDKNTNQIENVDTSCFQLCLAEDQTWVHTDPNDYTAILYLNPKSPIEAGTGIYRHKETGLYHCLENNYINSNDFTNNNIWELITFVGNIFNRLIIFRGCLYHRSVLPGFGFDKYTGRLTQTFFFNVEE